MRAHEAKMCALAMPYKESDSSQQKSRKCIFRPFLNRHQKKLFYSLLLIRQKYYESSKTEYSDSTSFINRLTTLIFWVLKFFRGAKNFAFFLLLFQDNRITWNYSLSVQNAAAEWLFQTEKSEIVTAMTSLQFYLDNFMRECQSGQDARLHMECHAGQVWPSFHFHVDHPPPKQQQQQHQRHYGPSRQPRRLFRQILKMKTFLQHLRLKKLLNNLLVILICQLSKLVILILQMFQTHFVLTMTLKQLHDVPRISEPTYPFRQPRQGIAE